MPKQLEVVVPSQVCLICRRGIEAIEQTVMIAGVLLAHERCAQSSRRD